MVAAALPVLALFGTAELYVGTVIFNAGMAAGIAGTEGAGLTLGLSVAMAVTGWVLIAIVFRAYLWAWLRLPLPHASVAWRAAAIALFGIVFTFVHLGGMSLAFVTAREAFAISEFPLVFSVLLRNYWLFEVFTYALIVAVYQLVRITRESERSQRLAAELQAKLAEARLDALSAQLNPHFLFNSLNAISGLVLKGDTESATETLGRLSDLLRRVLDRRDGEIALAEEMRFIDDYLELHRLRFSDRLTVEKDVADNTLDALVPAMLLQPIVENALKHGLAKSLGPHRVRVSAARKNSSLVLEVDDSGGGFTEFNPRDGIGLSNTRERLDQLYGPAHQFEIGTARGGGASVRVTIPFVMSHAASA